METSEAPTTAAKPPEMPAVVDGEKQHPLALSRGAVVVLRDIVRMPGWAKGDKQLRRAIKLGKRLPKLVVPEGMSEEERDEWLAVAHPITLGERDRDLAKACVRHFVDAGSFSPTEHVEALLTELGVIGD